MSRAIVICGLTGAGKTDASYQVAEILDHHFGSTKWQFFNYDLMQFYQGVELGTGKPSIDFREQYPHMFMDFLELSKTITVGEYFRFFKEKWNNTEKSLWVGVGGSAFYLQALENGLYPVPKGCDRLREALQRELSKKGELALWEDLRNIDPEAARKIHPRDHYRVLRSLEIFRSSGELPSEVSKKFSQTKEKGPLGGVLKLGVSVEREQLRQRIKKRTTLWLKEGWVEEVEKLRIKGPLPILLSVGFRQIAEYLRGGLARVELEDAIVRETMRLAKKQMTWLKRDQSIRWFSHEELPFGLENELRKVQL